ncbi:MAG: hypothetical protein Q7R96_02055, partial [Nanoarchaeota archaeon]|nr:hypothetical protein [Nanoarchaeota archaeon]
KDYAKQVFAGYNGASLDELGTEICKAAIYGKAPDVGQFIDEISKPESPPQYSAYYNEKYYSDIKGYKENMYTYGYHIFAGSRSAMTYSVYMKAVDAAGTTIINYPAISIARGKTLQAGQFATESKPLIAPEGYNQICIETRSERYGMNTKCGFGKVTTDFGVNYLVDEYVTKTAETRNIKTADQCVPETRGSATNQGVLAGTASHGLAAPLGGMVGGAVGGLTGGTLGGGFQETGIIRQCSTYNPGVGTAEDNWKVVGTCGKDDKGRELGTCWLYTANLKQLVQNQNNVQEIEATIVNLTEEQRVDRAQQLGLIIMDPAEAKQQLDSIQATLQMYNNYFTNQFEQATFDKAVEDIKVILDPYLKTILTQNFNVEQDLRARYTLGLAYEQLARLHLWKQKFTQLQQPTTITPAPQGTPTTTQTTPNPIITDLVLKLNRNTVFTVRGGSYIITVKESLQEKISIAITGVSQPIILLKNQPTAIDIDNSLTQDIKLTYQGLNNDLDILLSVEELPQKTVTTPAPATTAPGTTTNQPISTNTCILNKQRTGISIASNALLLYPPTKEVETAYYHLTTTGCINKEATITLETPQNKIEKKIVIQKNAEVITLPLNTKIAAQNLKDKVQLTLDKQETYQPIKTYTLAADESTAFTLLEEQHTLGVEQATEQETTVTIASTPQTLTIKKGETKTVDIDEYNSNDLSITYQGLNEQQKALLRIEELPQPDNIMHIFTLKKSGNDLAYRNALEKYEKENTAKKPLVKILDIPISDEAEQPTTQKIIIDTPAVKASETTIQQTATALETTTATAKKDLEEEAITCTTEPITEEPTEEKSEDIQKLETIQQHINEVKTLSTKLSKELIGMNGLFTTLKEIAQNAPQGTIQLPGTYTVPVYQGLPSNLPGTYYTKIIDGKEYITDYNLPGLEIRPLAYSNYVLLFRLDMRTNNPNERSLPLDTIIKKVKQQPQLTITGRPPSIAAKNLRTFNEAQQLYTSMQQSYDRLTTLLYSSEGGLSYGDLAFMQNNCELIHLSKEEANHYYDDLASIGGEIESYRKGLASIQQQLDTYAIHGIPQLP